MCRTRSSRGELPAAVHCIFKVKVTVMGTKEDQHKELVMLSRKIRWTRRVLTWEAEP